MAFVEPSSSAVRSSELFAVHCFLLRLCSAIGTVFLWLFIFVYLSAYIETRQALATTLLFYALVQCTDVLFLPAAMRLLGNGMRRGLIWGTVTLACVFVYASVLLGGGFAGGAAIIAVLMGGFGSLYRVPYALQQAMAGSQTTSVAAEIVLAAAPLFAGLALSAGALPATLLLVAGLIAVVALFPLLFVPNIHEQYMWGYRETFAHLVAHENRGLLIGSLSRGVYGSLFFLALPLTLYLLSGSFLEVGALFSAILLLLLALRSFAGGRAFLVQRADAGTYLDEYTALKEMALALGRLALPLIAGIALFFGV